MKSNDHKEPTHAASALIPPAVTESDYAQPHTLTIHLPTPGNMPGWPFHNIGQWRVDVNQAVPAWRQGMKIWRTEHLMRMGYDDSQYRRKELLWSQRNYVHAQMMVEDRYFYDVNSGKYTVDRYLDDLEQRYGGIDSVLIWYIYPNIGVDDRNQFDMGKDLPGGIDGLKQVVADFHRRGVRVFLPTMPWDNGTREELKPLWESITTLAKEVNADGINGDTFYAVPRAFREASDAIGHPVVLQPETWPIADDAIMWNNQTWGKASTSVVPAVSKLKWLESRHLTNVENRWGRDRTDDFHYIFFNGHGYNAWENVWGIWNQLTPRAGETLRRIATLFRKFSELLVSPDWEPYAVTLNQGVFATKFPGKHATLWTIVNRNEYEISGEQLVVNHQTGWQYFDVWNGMTLIPRMNGDEAVISLPLEAKGYGAVLAVDENFDMTDLDLFLGKMKNFAEVPLCSLSNEWKSLHQQMVPISATPPVRKAPEGMVSIPPGEFDFRVSGIEVEGFMWDGVDFQYPWENSPRRMHHHRMEMKSFYMDQFPVTNAEFLKFINAVGYTPKDRHNFLCHWKEGQPLEESENKPVVWISIEDARAYAAWAGKRLPHEWEWQYAAQGTDHRLYPWGNDWDDKCVPHVNKFGVAGTPANVDAHPKGASPFGIMDLLGNVWQWTDEFSDDHTRAASLRGGSLYQPQTSHWYFPQAYRLDQHGKYLLMSPGRDRAGLIGFRCVADIED